jgi:hypothetical protein
VFVDTAGVVPVDGPQTYITWIYAKTSPLAPPVSGVLVKFDCKQQLVKRISHVVYHEGPIHGSVTGEIVRDTMGWQPAKDPRIIGAVCAYGAQYDAMKAKMDAWDKRPHPAEKLPPERPPFKQPPVGTWKSA